MRTLGATSVVSLYCSMQQSVPVTAHKAVQELFSVGDTSQVQEREIHIRQGRGRDGGGGWWGGTQPPTEASISWNS